MLFSFLITKLLKTTIQTEGQSCSMMHINLMPGEWGVGFTPYNGLYGDWGSAQNGYLFQASGTVFIWLTALGAY